MESVTSGAVLSPALFLEVRPVTVNEGSFLARLTVRTDPLVVIMCGGCFALEAEWSFFDERDGDGDDRDEPTPFV